MGSLFKVVWGLIRDLTGLYRPERHYMRGPGPAWRAKHPKPRSGAARAGRCGYGVRIHRTATATIRPTSGPFIAHGRLFLFQIVGPYPFCRGGFPI